MHRITMNSLGNELIVSQAVISHRRTKVRYCEEL